VIYFISDKDKKFIYFVSQTKIKKINVLYITDIEKKLRYFISQTNSFTTEYIEYPSWMLSAIRNRSTFRNNINGYQNTLPICPSVSLSGRWSKLENWSPLFQRVFTKEWMYNWYNWTFINYTKNLEKHLKVQIFDKGVTFVKYKLKKMSHECQLTFDLYA
jgi:hypothetical protein